MAITRVGSASADAATVTMPAGHKIGDLFVMYAFRSALTAPSLPAGWTSVASASNGATSYRLGWKLAVSSSDTSGTWTNASGLVCIAYRGVVTGRTPVSALVAQTGTSATVTYQPLTLSRPGTSWLAAFAATKTTTATIETAPTNMVNQTDTVGVANEYVGHDTNGVYTSASWPSTNVSVGTSAEWRSAVLEIYADQGVPNNYQFLKAQDNGNAVLSFSERIR